LGAERTAGFAFDQPVGLIGPASCASAFRAFEPFPEGLEGLGAGIEDRGLEKKGKAFMPLYEHVYLARQDLSAQQVEELTTQLSGVIGQMGGKVTKNEYWGLKSLTYRIHKNRKAHMTLLNVDAPPAALNEIERQERLHEDVLRYLTIRVDAHEDGPSAMMRKSDRDRDERGERGERGGRRRRDEGDDIESPEANGGEE
jgi:small subunit ribosomal protein S6